jgi:hypothetical protein
LLTAYLIELLRMVWSSILVLKIEHGVPLFGALRHRCDYVILSPCLTDRCIHNGRPRPVSQWTTWGKLWSVPRIVHAFLLSIFLGYTCCVLSICSKLG